MNKDINFNNEEYYFIITEKEKCDMSLNLIDISIFEINEWKNILNMSIKFDEAIRFAAQDSEYSYNVLLQSDEYFLKMYYLNHIFLQLTI
jgi:hypothetical protein